MIEWGDPAICQFSDIDPEGFVTFQPSYFGTATEQGGGPTMGAMHPFGFMSRPRDPDVDASGNVKNGSPLFYAYFGDRGYALPLFDPRNAGQPTLPTPDKGGGVLYCDVGNGRFATLEMKGDDGMVTITVPEGASIRLKAPSGRSTVVSATGTDIVGITNAGVVTAEDPGTPPAPVAIAGPIANYVTACEAYDALLLAAVLKIPVPLTPAESAALNAAAATRIALASTLSGVYPGGMAATRLNTR